jgi:predicted metal-dependent enzyme (double-stranded beta helix superfamily)
MSMPTAAPAILTELVDAVRAAIAVPTDWEGTAELVAGALRENLPGPDVLTPAQREGDPERYVSHTLHIEPDGTFSVIALVWRPGQTTRIHDHLTWCVFGVIQGVEHEELFDADGRPLGSSDNSTGDVSGFAPPGDIHRVHNVGDTTAISIHIYGTDVSRVASSVRRFYD